MSGRTSPPLPAPQRGEAAGRRYLCDGKRPRAATRRASAAVRHEIRLFRCGPARGRRCKLCKGSVARGGQVVYTDSSGQMPSSTDICGHEIHEMYMMHIERSDRPEGPAVESRAWVACRRDVRQSILRLPPAAGVPRTPATDGACADSGQREESHDSGGGPLLDMPRRPGLECGYLHMEIYQPREAALDTA